MTDDFDTAHWESHWDGHGHTDRADVPAHPYIAEQLGELEPGTALDAGCGSGAEALWLAEQGWTVTAVDISRQALAAASERASRSEGGEMMTFIEADLSTWEPGETFALVTTYYGHAATSQLEFYKRISRWVAPGGTVLIVGHQHTDHGSADGGITAQRIVATFDLDLWNVATAAERSRPAHSHPIGVDELRDVVVRLTRRP